MEQDKNERMAIGTGRSGDPVVVGSIGPLDVGLFVRTAGRVLAVDVPDDARRAWLLGLLTGAALAACGEGSS